jgi:hypothetical protein
LTCIVGAYGSGKTEIAVNYALALAAAGESVRIADLDIINPYFRSREAREELESCGVRVYAPEGGDFFADLPIILPEIRGLIADGVGCTIFDVGGDDLGARVLSSFHDLFQRREYDLLMVLNRNRPFTDTVAGCLDVLGRIEEASRLRVTGLIANPHLMSHTDAETIYRGCDVVREVSERTGVPLVFLAVEAQLAPRLDAARLGCAVLPLERRMLPPWQSAGRIGRPQGRGMNA